MGLLELAFGSESPITKWADNNSNALGNLGAGIASGGFKKGFGIAAQGAGAAKQADQARSKTVQWLLENNMTDLMPLVQAGQIGAAYTIGMKRMEAKATPVDPTASYEGRIQAGREQGLSGDALSTYALTSKLPGGNQTPRAGVGQPLFGRNKKTGQIEPWQSMTDGTMVNIANPNANPADYDFNPAIGSQARASGTAQGRIGGTTAANLPISAQTAENALATIQKLRGFNADGTVNKRMQQGFNDTFGTYGIGPIQIPDKFGITWPTSEKADYGAVLDQATGQAFLTAYQQLRGSGAITEVEGQKAGDAIARMSRAQSKEAFNEALNDYESVIKSGYARLQQQAANSGGVDPNTMPQIGGPIDMGNGITIMQTSP